MSTEEDGVAELRSTVEELEATVRGLTEELVEANERLRALEAHVEDGAAAAGGSQAPDETHSPSRARAEEVKNPESENGDNDTDESTVGDDIIVA